MAEPEQLQATLGESRQGISVPAGRRKSNRAVTIASIAGLVVVITLAVLAGVNASRSAADARAGAALAIAVIPFENVGGDEGKELAEGMTEEITTHLSAVRGLRVVGRQSAKSYENTRTTPQQIASELGVRYILTGTVRWDRSADGKDLVRVSPALLDADDTTQLWADAYQSSLSGVFDVQSKVANQVVSALNVSLLPPEKSAIATSPTRNLEAYRLFLRARQLYEANAGAGTLREAAALLERATAADPRFTAAWAYLAIVRTELFRFAGDRSERRLQLARDALTRAAGLDQNSPDVHLARAIYRYQGEMDYEGALTELAEAERERPSDSQVPSYRAAILRKQGKFNEAASSLTEAAELEPRNATIVFDLATTLAFLRRYEEAETNADRGMLLDPGNPAGPALKANVAIDLRGNVPEAVEHLRNAMQSVRPQSALVGLLQSATWPAVQDPMLRQIMIDAAPTSDEDRGIFLSRKALLFEYLGDPPRARAYADSAAAILREKARASSEPSPLYSALALAESIRGHGAQAFEAIRKSERALPSSADQFSAALRANLRASILARLDDRDAAIAALEQQVIAPGGFSKNVLRLDPIFSTLRLDARFQRLIDTP